LPRFFFRGEQPIERIMAGPFFDVYVVGAADNSPAGLAALASALSGPLGMPAAMIAKALAERKLCAGKGMIQQDAQALVRELKPLGASTMIRPTSPNDTPTRLTAPPSARPVPPPPVRPGPPPPVRGAGPPSLSLASEPADPFAPPPSGPQGLALDGPNTGALEFGSPPSSPSLGLAVGSPGGAQSLAATPSLAQPAPPVGRDPFAGGPEDEDPRLELDVAPPQAKPTAASVEVLRPSTSHSLPGASALNLNKMTASSSASGLSVDKAVAAEAYRVRCHKHGLLYDTRKASGCGKCMDAGRKLSAAIEAKAAGIKIADFENAAKRAFIGLALALVIGFIPAAYHAFRVGGRDIHRLRDEQEVLSRKPATEEIVARFEELNTTVDNASSRATRTTGIVWLVVSGLALFGWYRVTTDSSQA
jgi:hypothetical protein